MSKVVPFLLGGVVGAGIALAFAPQTGEQTRALVTEKANAFAGEAKDFASGMPGSAQDLVKSAREQGAAMVNKGVETDSDELREKIEAARQRIAAQVMENAEKAKADAVVDVDDKSVEEAKHAAQ